jgi:hypothetical protein
MISTLFCQPIQCVWLLFTYTSELDLQDLLYFNNIEFLSRNIDFAYSIRVAAMIHNFLFFNCIFSLIVLTLTAAE